MTYDRNDEKSEGYGRSDAERGGFDKERFSKEGFGRGGWGRGGFDRHGDWLNWARQPGFHPLKAVATVAAFAVFPPLGVLTLGYFLWNSRRGWGPQAYAGGASFEGRGSRGRCGHGGRMMRRWSTGNDAFDEHQREQFMKMREERHAFHEYRADARRKRDQEAFDAFRAAEAAKPAGEDKKD